MFPQLFGKYVLERELASGGMAIVYLATLRGAGGFEKRLVVKQIRAELASDRAFVERFVAEAKTTVGLSHPNIVPVYELGVEQGVYFIAMELALGVTLSELTAASGPLSPEEGAHIGVEICRALDYAHRKAGVVHRDVTPRNVLVDEEGHVRLIDFGIAAPVSTPGSAREHVFGSPGHMPPEQIRGGRLSPATDVFAVAALLVEAWTGRAPFRRATRDESDRALFEARPPLSDARPELGPLDELFERALAADPEERPPTAEDLARPLRDFLRTADLGDLARKLGARVRKARRSPSLAELLTPPFTPAGRTPHTPVLAARPTARSEGGTRPLPSEPPGPVTPVSQGGPITETFATRDDVAEWTRGSSFPPDPPGLAPPDRLPPPPRTPGGLDLEGDEREGVGEEDDEDGAEPPTPAPSPAASRRLGMVVAAALGLAAGLALWLSSGPTPPSTQSGPETAPTSGRIEPRERGGSASGRVSATPSEVPPVPAAPREPPAADAAALVRAPGQQQAPAGREASGEVAPLTATLRVTSDLPARVSVDGLSLGGTPVHVKRPAGPHQVTLTSTTLGETLTARVVATEGATVSVHGEFTRPVPALRVR